MKRLLFALGLCLFSNFALGQTIQYPPNSGITKASTPVLASSLIVKAAPAYLYAINVSADSTLSGAAWWVIVFDAITLPVNGTVTPAKCYAQASGTTQFSLNQDVPVFYTTGVVIGVSTTGCFSTTASVHAFISADFQ